MDISAILYPVLSIGGLGVLFGAGLGFAAIKFAVKVDERVLLVREALPGANCGGCGFAGCDALAAAIVEEGAKVNSCPVGGASCAAAIAEIMGVEAESAERKTAFVMCGGDCEKSKSKYVYYGLDDCNMASQLPGGTSKSCDYGCMGLGSCKKSCQFGAIEIIDGISVINKEKCVACGACISACPKKLIEFVPADKHVRVKCHSKDNGKTTRGNCSVGCIACKMCEKACEFDAVHVESFLAKIDYTKCTQCNACANKCPQHCIIGVHTNNESGMGKVKEQALV